VVVCAARKPVLEVCSTRHLEAAEARLLCRLTVYILLKTLTAGLIRECECVPYAQQCAWRSSVLPVFLLLIVVSGFALLQSSSLVFVSDLVPGKDPCADESCFKFSRREVVWRSSESFKANDAIHAYTIDESESTWKNLNAQFRDEKWAVVDVDFQDASFIVRWRKRLSKVSPNRKLQMK
jgi:hypothetical protein